MSNIPSQLKGRLKGRSASGSSASSKRMSKNKKKKIKKKAKLKQLHEDKENDSTEQPITVESVAVEDNPEEAEEPHITESTY